MNFPTNFTWGVASAAYQIEGATREDGRGQTTWDDFCRRPGTVFHGHTGDTACDHYHRWAEDVSLMRDLGVKAYRLSLAWSRILPDGDGTVNQAGIDFYSRLLDALRDANIEPWVTLFHWDYPLALHRRGGWLNPESARWLADYAALCARTFGDRVRHWIPFNEPQCVINLGHGNGEHAPGLRLPRGDVLQAMHHTHLATALAAQALHASSPRPAEVGSALATTALTPFSDAPADVAAAEAALWTQSEQLWSNPMWADPILRGRYPAEMEAVFGPDAPRLRPGDAEILAACPAAIDFCGLNLYSAHLVRAGADGKPQTVLPPPGYVTTTQNGWHVTPSMMRWLPRWWHARYGKPIVITENGHQNLDHVYLDGKVHDPQRIDYLHRHLRELRRGMAEGADVRGYFHWTLMDNFEWALGYNVRVGLVHVDFATQVRTPKGSFAWYREVIRSICWSLC